MERKVLIVDDDPMTVKLVQALLHTSEYETIAATNGEEGVKLAKDKKPHLVLMDVIMPRMNGYDACRAIKADQGTRKIPVLLLTSINEEGHAKLSRGCGANGYINKSSMSQELLEKISQFLPTS